MTIAPGFFRLSERTSFRLLASAVDVTMQVLATQTSAGSPPRASRMPAEASISAMALPSYWLTLQPRETTLKTFSCAIGLEYTLASEKGQGVPITGKENMRRR